MRRIVGEFNGRSSSIFPKAYASGAFITSLVATWVLLGVFTTSVIGSTSASGFNSFAGSTSFAGSNSFAGQDDPVEVTESQDDDATNSATDDAAAGDDPAEGESDVDGDSVDEILAGHSAHGDVFNEGPRQKAYLMKTTGNISFPVSTENEEAQAFINQGVGQLHGFWYLEAERSFRQAAAIDPECAMAYWGCAMSNRSKRDRAEGFLEEAMARIDGVTDREKRYIEALNNYFKADQKNRRRRAENYHKALEDICLEYPEDLEAKAFLALQIYQSRSEDLPIGSYLAADALMQEIFEVEPFHPTHHFCIHLWDHRKPEKALPSAARCGPAAPGIAHMWHMPGHIYSRLKRYEDAVWQQEASARVDHAHMMRDRVMPDEISNFAHNNEWLIRNLIFIGRVDDALDLARNMTELPRHPKYNTLRRGSTRYGRERLFDVLTKYELWETAIELCHADYLEATDRESEQQKRARLLGAAYFMSGRVELGEELLAEFREQRDALEVSREEKIAEARAEALKDDSADDADAVDADDAAKDGDADTCDPSIQDDDNPAAPEVVQEDDEKEENSELDKKIEEINKEIDGKIKQIDKTITAIEGYRAIHAGDMEEAYKKLKEAGTENKDLVIEVRHAAGETEEALKEAREQVNRRKNEVLPLCRLVYLLHQSELMDEAKETMEKLRAISGSIDMQSELFTRLTPIAVELGFPEDWRVESMPADDIGERFALSELGPFRWRPSPAPDWMLPMADNSTRSSKEFQGQPVILIFYLGYGCLHCAEQLHAFAPQIEEFEKAGIKLLAVSTDNVESLQQSIDDYEEGLPIPLVSDESQQTFKAFRAFDDFENVPLHGTFLIDANGLIRWQDISYEPFMDHEFLLKESQRLLAQVITLPVSEEGEASEEAFANSPSN